MENCLTGLFMLGVLAWVAWTIYFKEKYEIRRINGGSKKGTKPK